MPAVSAGELRPTATISAPAAAKATAIPWPMPVLAPVTRAVRPTNENSSVWLIVVSVSLQPVGSLRQAIGQVLRNPGRIVFIEAMLGDQAREE